MEATATAAHTVTVVTYPGNRLGVNCSCGLTAAAKTEKAGRSMLSRYHRNMDALAK
jgi:hypothetical protein